jgi:hypothetical protein
MLLLVSTALILSSLGTSEAVSDRLPPVTVSSASSLNQWFCHGFIPGRPVDINHLRDKFTD